MTFDDRDGFIWFDGEMVPWREAKVHVLTHTLHYGMGVFEGVRAYKTDQNKTAIFRLADHTKRLFRSAHILNMKIPFDKDQLNQAQNDVVKANKLFDGAYLRPMCFYGSEGMGLRADNLQVHVIVAAWEWGNYFGDKHHQGLKIKTSSFTRHHVNITMCKAKANGNYMNSMLALQEANACGADDVMMLDVEGYVAEGSGANIFVVRDGIIYTPDLTSALDGITRNTVMMLAERAGFKITEKRITRDEVYIADEMFFTGTAAEVTPIGEVDGRIIGTGNRGPVTEQLQSQYFDLVHGRVDGFNEYYAWVE